MHPFKAIIIGSGAAGSVAFKALKRAGAVVTAYERASAIAPVGAGITLAPNGLYVLSKLDNELLGRIRSVSQPNLIVSAYSNEGQRLGGTDFSNVEGKFGFPLLGLTRHDLQTELSRGMRQGTQAGPDVDLVMGRTAVRVEESPSGRAVVHFSDGSSDEADVVIGADGARSAVAAYVTGTSGSDSLRPTGFTCTYGLTFEGSYPEAQTGVVSWVYGKGRSWGTWCLPNGRAFWFTVHRHGEIEGEGGEAMAGAWAAGKDRLSVIQKAFGGLYHPGKGGFDHMLHSSDRAATFGLADRAAHDFAKGRVALIGDAARTVTPWGGQGANMAIEDAAELANVLAPLIRSSVGAVPKEQVVAALQKYHTVRARRSAAVTAFSRQTGSLQMMKGWTGDALRRVALNTPTWATEASIGWLYGHKVDLA